MRKILTTLVIMLFCTICLCAQSSNKYVVKLKNGIDIECVSYKLTSDNNIDITYADGSNVSIKMDDVEKISPIEVKKESAVRQNQQTVQTRQQSVQPAQQTYQSSQQQIVYGNQPQTVYVKPPKSPALAGILSFFIPGAGQFYNGHIGAGVGFLLGAGFSYGLAIGAAEAGNAELTLLFLCTTLAVDIWAIVHAVKGAKRENIARGYAANGHRLDISPIILSAPSYAHNGRHAGAYGMSFGMRF